MLAILAWVLVSGWPRLIRAEPGPFPFLVAWGSIYAVMLVSTIWRPFDPMFYGSLPESHALAAMALPVALMIVTWYWAQAADPGRLLRAAAMVIIPGMCTNTVIQTIQLASGRADVLTWLPRFWDATPGDGSVAANAASDARYTGIFNQPAEAGIAFGVALLMLIWLGRRELHPVVVTVAAVFLTAGGVLTISKVFLLCALPAAAVTVLRGRARIRVIATGAVCACGAWLAGSAGWLPQWRLGIRSLGILAHPGASLTAQYSAGRYGGGGTLAPVTSDVLHNAPLAGFGAGGLAGPAFDSLWQELLVLSGVLGVLLALAVFMMLSFRVMRMRRVLNRADWHLACGALFIATGASLGIPSLTANRASTILWLPLGLLVTARSAQRRPARRVARIR